jgi:transcriptional regulator with XRE-family HTH domain
MNMMQRRLECGLKRNRMRRRIQERLDSLDMTQADLARQAGVSRQLVSSTLLGEKHSPPVLEALRKLGVPERYLCDPNQGEAA